MRQLNEFFVEHKNSSDELHLTVLTTLQCNFACDYCLQGDHDEYNKSGHQDVSGYRRPGLRLACGAS